MPQSLIFIKRGQTVIEHLTYLCKTVKGIISCLSQILKHSKDSESARILFVKNFCKEFQCTIPCCLKILVVPRCHLWIPSATLEVHQGPVGPLEVRHPSRIAPWASESTREILRLFWNACKEFAPGNWKTPSLHFDHFAFYILLCLAGRVFPQPLTAPRTPPLPSTKFPSKPSVKKASWWLVQAESQNGSKVNATRISTNSTIKSTLIIWFLFIALISYQMQQVLPITRLM